GAGSGAGYRPGRAALGELAPARFDIMKAMSQRETTFSPPVSLSKLSEIEAALGEAIRGKPEVVRLSLTCLLARGHLLIEDVPGVGKTTLAQALARSVDSS